MLSRLFDWGVHYICLINIIALSAETLAVSWGLRSTEKPNFRLVYPPSL